MRARRLRRLGLIEGDTSATTTTTTTATSSTTETPIKSSSDLAENIAKASHTAAKNIMCPEIEENDENQHKQKQQKFDNVMKMEIGLNNNMPSLTIDTTKTSPGRLTQRSRLLDEIEKQRIENKLNQNVPDTTDVPKQQQDIDMEAETPNKSTESDSGIENMETDELSQAVESSLTAKNPVDVALSPKAKEQEAEICLSRILDAFWFEHCEGQIIVSDTANFYKEVIVDEENALHFDDLAFQIITEIIEQYFDGKRIDFKASGADSSIRSSLTSSSSAAANTSEPERMDTGELNCMTPNLKPHNLADHGALTYLIQSYERCSKEQANYNSTRNRQKYETAVLDVIAQVKKQLISSAKLLLNGTMAKQLRSCTQAQTHRSILLKLMYDNAIPPDFLELLVEDSHTDAKTFNKIFGTFVQNLYVDMQSRVVSKNIDTSPINILKQLLEITISGNIRPICNLVTSLPNFCPALCTGTQGREIVKLSYLGPFLSLSVFSEENPKLAEDVDDNWEETFGNGLRIVSENSFEHFLCSCLRQFGFSNYKFHFSNWTTCVANCTQYFTVWYEAQIIAPRCSSICLKCY